MNVDLSRRASILDWVDVTAGERVAFALAVGAADSFDDLPGWVQQLIVDGEQNRAEAMPRFG